MSAGVTIIVLTWNGLAYTRRCIHSLAQFAAGVPYRLLVVDNGSTDGTVEFLQSLQDVILILNRENLGFAAANNLGIERSDPDDVVLLNNDIEIIQAGWLENLRQAACSAPEVGIVGCRLRWPGGRLQHAGTYVPVDTLWGQQWGGGERDINQFNRIRDVEGIVFACAYIKRDVIRAVGNLSTEYFAYFEDSDYCLQAKRHGFRTLCCGNTTLFHHENTSAQENKVKFKNLFETSRKTFVSKWKRHLESEYKHRLGWHSIMNFPSGYAVSSRALALALDDLKVWIGYRYAYGPGTVFPLPEPEQSDNHRINLIQKREIDSKWPQVMYAQGDVFEQNFGRYKIGFTMLETDRIPQEWARQANRMDEVWVPSTFNRDTFIASGVKRPIRVIPLGVDEDYYNLGIAAHKPSGKYVFLSVFEWGERKAPEILLKAFNDEFRANEDVLLCCKIINRDGDVNVRSEIKKLALNEQGGQIVFLLNAVVPGYQLGALYRSADAFVLPTRGEGFGMPMIEAMACGLPVIATDWSSHTDFMTGENSYLLRVEKLIPAVAKCPYYTGFHWAHPSYEHLRQLMRHVFENQDEARARGRRASQDILQNWTWHHSAQRIVHELNRLSTN